MSCRMLHVWFDVFCVFYTSVLFALMPSGQGQSAVIGPVQPIVAAVGDDVILPCYLYPTMDASDMSVEWNRPDMESRLVHVWPERAELLNPSYKGRTSLLINELQHGNISLKISKVKLSDEGTYRCFVLDLQRDAAVRLVVGAASSPAIKINRTSSRVVLQCESAGWYPEPELLWLDSEGNLLPAGPTETLRGPDGLYTVSSRVTVEKRHSNNITCRVHQKNINQSRETHIHVPDDFFMVISPSSPPTEPTIDPNTITGLVIGAVVVLLLIPAVFFVVWKRRRDKCTPRRNMKSEEDGPEQTRKEKMIESKTVNCEFHFEVEEGESEALMAGREEEDDVESRGEKNFKEERKRADHHVTEAELKGGLRRSEEETMNQFILTEKVSQSTTGQETDGKQEMRGRGMKAEGGEGEREKQVEGGKDDLGLQCFPLTEAKSFNLTSHLNTDQKPQREKEKQQEQLVEQRQRERNVTRKKTEGEEKRKEEKRSEQKKRREHQREKQLEERREKNQRKNQSETRMERDKDETELKYKNHQHKEEKTQERSEEEPEDEKHGEGNQRESLGMTERKTEEQRGQEESRNSSVSGIITLNTDLKIQDKRGQNQEKQPEEKPDQSREETREQPEEQRRAQTEEDQGGVTDVSTEETYRKDEENKTSQLRQEGQLQTEQQENINQRNQSERRAEGEEDETKVNTQEDKHNQHGLEKNKTEKNEAEPEDKKEKEGKQRNDRKADQQRSDQESRNSSVSSKVRESIGVKKETEIQVEQPEEKSHQSREEAREQPEEQRRAESKEDDQGGVMDVSTEETHRKDEENKTLQLRQEGQLQMEQQENINQNIFREQPEEPVSLSERGVDCQADRTPDDDQKNIKSEKHKADRELHQVQRVSVRKVKHQRESRAQIQKRSKMIKESLKEQRSDQKKIINVATTARLDQDQQKLRVQEETEEGLKGSDDCEMADVEMSEGDREEPMKH